MAFYIKVSLLFLFAIDVPMTRFLSRKRIKVTKEKMKVAKRKKKRKSIGKKTPAHIKTREK